MHLDIRNRCESLEQSLRSRAEPGLRLLILPECFAIIGGELDYPHNFFGESWAMRRGKRELPINQTFHPVPTTVLGASLSMSE